VEGRLSGTTIPIDWFFLVGVAVLGRDGLAVVGLSLDSGRDDHGLVGVFI